MRAAIPIILWPFFALICGATLILSAAYLYLDPQIPDVATFTDVKLRAPLRIFTADGKLIQEFGERLVPVTYDQIPHLFTRALLDTEDKRFFEHRGIDLITVMNATWQLVVNRGEIRTGASTITMQLVKNISGEKEVRFIRKFKEMLLSLKLEQELTKEEILTLYVNMIPFGKHAFGIQAAANTYYGKNIDELTLAQTAMLAGIPQAPEAGNPINGPARAIERRNLVLLRMFEQRTITEEDYEAAIAAPITARVYGREVEVPALYLAEAVRKHLLREFGNNVYNEGLSVWTTLDSRLQLAAEKAVETKLIEYDRRHGYRGPEFRRIQGTDEFLASPESGYPANWVTTLETAKVLGNQHPAIVTAVHDDRVEVLTQGLEVVSIPFANMVWARPYIDVDTRGARPLNPAAIVGPGDLIRIHETGEGDWGLGQIPAIQGALISIAPNDGAIKAWVGGYDFNAKQYDHVVQARRQPGSSFKPFFYAAALESGLTAASIFNDAPIVLPGGDLEEMYRPTNSGDTFQGSIRLREALYRSINLVSLRVILDLGPDAVISYVSRFGFDTSNFPRNVQLAFGGGTIGLTPLEVATGYAAFANGGFKVEPHFIRRISSINHGEMALANPPRVCEPAECGDEVPKAPRIIEARVAYIMNSILSDVMTKGTGTKAVRALERSDLMGKTGTTNDADIWFAGFTHDLVATTWAGFDDNSPVGNREWGSTTPIETWIEFMREALPSVAESTKLPFPNGLVSVRIDPETGLRADPSDPDAIFEMFREEQVPPQSTALARKEERGDPVKQIF